MLRMLRRILPLMLLGALVECGGTTSTSPVDTTAPTTRDDAPSGWIQAAEVTVHLTATDGATKTCYRLDSAAETCAAPNVSAKVTGEGAHTLQYHSVDAAGNVEQSHAVEVKLDATAPVTTDNAPTGWIPGLVYVSLSASDASAGIAKTCWTIDTGAEACGSGPILLSGDGDHTLAYYSVDNAGNAEAPHSVHVKVQQTTLPVLAINATRNSGTTQLQIGCGVADGLSGIDPGSLRISITDRKNTVTDLTSCDEATFAVADAPFTVAAQVLDEVGHLGSVEVKLDLDLSGRIGCAVEVAGSTPGSGCGAIQNIDGVAPVTTSDAPSGFVASASVNLAATDDWSGVARTCYSLDSAPEVCEATPLNLSVATDGIHLLVFHSVDYAGNIEVAKLATLYVDTSPPVSTLDTTVPDSGWFSATSIGLDITSADALSEVAQLCFMIDGNGPYCSTLGGGPNPSLLWSLNVPGEGLHAVGYFAVDAVGNVEGQHNLTFGNDGTPPTTSDDAPAGWGLGPVTVTLTASDSASGAQQTCYTIDGSVPTCAVPPVSFSLTSDGDHTVQYASTDLAGNAESSHTIHVQLDDTPPTAQVNANWSKGAQTVDIGCVPTDGLSGVDTGNLSVTVGTQSNSTCSTQSYSFASGQSLEVTATVADQAGNTGTAEVTLSDNAGTMVCTPVHGLDPCGTITTGP